MSETHTTSKEVATVQELPTELQPLEKNLTSDNIAALDKLNIKYQEKLNLEWKDIFNKAFQEARDSGVSASEARILAEREAQAKAIQLAFEENKDDVTNLAFEFMEDIKPDDPDYDEKYLQAYNAVLAAAEMPVDEWAGDQEDDGSLTGNGMLHQLLEHKNKAEEPEEAEEPKEDPEKQARLEALEKMKEDIEKLRETKYKASVDLQRAPFWKIKARKEAKQAYAEALQAYKEKFAKYQQATFTDRQLLGIDEQEIIKELTDMTNEYVKGDIAAEKKLLVEQGGRMAKIMEHYANLPTRQKILYGIGITALFAGAGAGIGVIGGAIGAGALVTGMAAAGMAAGRFVRTYAIGMSKMYAKDPKIQEFTGQIDSDLQAYQQSLQNAKTLEERGKLMTEAGNEKHAKLLFWNRSADYLGKESDKVVERAEKVRRRAIGIAMGSVALGGVVGVAAHHAGDVAHLFGQHHPNHAPVHRVETHPQPRDPLASETSPADHLTPEAYHSYDIPSGGGGEQLMNNLHVDPQKWYSMQDELLRNHPQDFYRMPDGNVGFSHPGQLSPDTMHDISQRLGIWH